MIVVDSNEPESIVKRLREMFVEVEVRQIEYYDYIVKGVQGSVAVERKTVEDYVNSVLDGRIYYQTYKMSHDFDTSFVAVIGDIGTYEMEVSTKIGRETRNISSIYLGSLLGVCLKSSPDGRRGRIHVVVLPSNSYFVEFLRLLDKKLGEKDLFRLPVGGEWSEEGNYMVAMLMCIPGMGREKAKAVYEKFKTMENLVKADVSQIASVKGIGKILAERIYKSLR